MQSGLPDLYCSVPSYGPVLLEAKYLKEVCPKFNRTINYSALQKIFLQDCNKSINNTAFGLIGFKLDKQLYAAVISHHMTKIDYNFRDYCGWSVLDKKTKTFDIPQMFDTIGRLLVRYECEQPVHGLTVN